jgi:membrane protease YdiL (CAAX protease family)
LAALSSIPASAWLVAAVFATIGLSVYGQVAAYLARHGGKVQPEGFALPELLMSFVIGGYFLLHSVATFTQQNGGEFKITVGKVLPGALLFLLMAGGIVCFLHFVRHIHANRIFGFFNLGGLSLLGWTAGLAVGAIFLVIAINPIAQSVIKEKLVPQPLVTLFTELAQRGDPSISVIFVVGSVIAPCTEEFLFRGFFYRAWKRYLGPFGAGLIASALFAAVHGSVSALGGLFVLACCLTLAYERTGSLLVPIGMHASFNFANLCFLYVQARAEALPAPL